MPRRCARSSTWTRRTELPIQRYKDVSEMPPPPRPRGDELATRIRDVMTRAARLAGSGYPPGVYRFRSIEEAQEARQAVVRARVQARRRHQRV